jgi:transcriptional regulator with XRE-family HTH domain
MPQKAKYMLKDRDTLVKAIGENIKQIRKRKGLSQIELAEKIGISQKLLSHYEKGRLKISSDLIVLIAGALDVSSDLLLGLKKDTSNGQKASLKVVRRLNEIEELTGNQQRTIFKSIDLMLKAMKQKAD